ncbi:hypothetical protein PR202_ga28019 [Eleusine coracana subsp. coracana]|uniref:Secreted protein n=1 Tax=Eleusine coracana subsp. coracana TaxID=191504 RepID=A0AAV5DHI2_ELECO|nr:hypothetical protein PR202_ga28019 [Eleusine coracana subsp. coracana]
MKTRAFSRFTSVSVVFLLLGGWTKILMHEATTAINSCMKLRQSTLRPVARRAKEGRATWAATRARSHRAMLHKLAVWLSSDMGADAEASTIWRHLTDVEDVVALVTCDYEITHSRAIEVGLVFASDSDSLALLSAD